MTRDALEVIRERRSVRQYAPRDVSAATVDLLLEAATMAPSAGNLQPWHFYVVWSDEKKERLAGAALGQRFVRQAPVVIVVCADAGRSAARYGHRGAHLYSLQDTAAAAQNIHLAAVALGLGTCWVGAFDEGEVAAVLGVPPSLRPVVIIPVGYPDRVPAPRPRRPRAEVITVVR